MKGRIGLAFETGKKLQAVRIFIIVHMYVSFYLILVYMHALVYFLLFLRGAVVRNKSMRMIIKCDSED